MSSPGKHLRVEVQEPIYAVGATRYHARLYYRRAEGDEVIGVIHADAEQWEALSGFFELYDIEVKDVAL